MCDPLIINTPSMDPPRSLIFEGATDQVQVYVTHTKFGLKSFSCSLRVSAAPFGIKKVKIS